MASDLLQHKFNMCDIKTRDKLDSILNTYKEFVYIAHIKGSKEYKIGKTSQTIENYAKFLSNNECCNLTLYSIEVKSSTQVEKIMHLFYSKYNYKKAYRFSTQREWFKIDGNENDIINELVQMICDINSLCIKASILNNYNNISSYTHNGNYELDYSENSNDNYNDNNDNNNDSYDDNDSYNDNDSYDDNDSYNDDDSYNSYNEYSSKKYFFRTKKH